MKHWLTLGAMLFGIWLLWSGHYTPFMIGLGIVSCAFCLFVALRMRIVDEEGAPIHLGLRPFVFYAPWLIKEVIKANLDVTRIILSKEMPLHRNMVTVKASQKSELGRVILANSITLTPGTVSVGIQGDRILVHALSFEGAEEDLSGDMDRRVCNLEKRG